METAVITSHTAAQTKKRAKSPKYLFAREEAKNLLGDYAFSLIDEARKSDENLGCLQKARKGGNAARKLNGM